MRKLLFVVIALCLSGMAGLAFAYPDTWTQFDPNDLDAARDETMGNTQQMLEERGSVECIACHGETNDQYDGVMNTFEISEATMSAALSCMNWELRGICVWMTCLVPPVCSFSTSLKVKNHVPDLVIQSYDRANGEPWTESQDINQVSQGDADSSWVTTIISWIEDYNVDDVGIRGGVSTEAKKDQHANLYFKLVDAYGNPSLIAYNALAQTTFGLVCAGQTFPFFPYFISNLDSIAWRWDVPEMFYPQSWLPLVNTWDLGSVTNNYGAIYPRHGFMTAQDPLKAGVLSAFRAAHFITRSGEPHLYYTIDKANQDGYWPSDPLDQDREDTGIWQMLYPRTDSSCQRFPYGGNPSSNRRSTDGSYIWNFWKSYKCCTRQGQQLIFHEG